MNKPKCKQNRLTSFLQIFILKANGSYLNLSKMLTMQQCKGLTKFILIFTRIALWFRTMENNFQKLILKQSHQLKAPRNPTQLKRVTKELVLSLCLENLKEFQFLQGGINLDLIKFIPKINLREQKCLGKLFLFGQKLL